jgi:chromosome segregation ATPase
MEIVFSDGEIVRTPESIKRKVDQIMADISKLKEALGDLYAAAEGAEATIAAKDQKITELEAQGTGSSEPSQSEVDELTSQVQAETQRLQGTPAPVSTEVTGTVGAVGGTTGSTTTGTTTV